MLFRVLRGIKSLVVDTPASTDVMAFLDASDEYKAKQAQISTLLTGMGVNATAAELIRTSDVSVRRRNLTTSAPTLSESSYDGLLTTINRANGMAITLPAASSAVPANAATDRNIRFRIYIGTTVTSGSTTIKCASSSDIMQGFAVIGTDNTDNAIMFHTAADTDTITLNGTTTGGYIGGYIEFEEVGNSTWSVRMFSKATGTEATPFSATV